MNTGIQIEGKVVLLTGAFGLIGKTITHAFLTSGAKVILCDSNMAGITAIRAHLGSFQEGRDYIISITDITDEQACALCVRKSIEAFGRIDVLINNAAIDAKFDAQSDESLNSTRFEHFPIAQLDRSYAVNVKGLVQITQSVIKHMLVQGHGNIINVASTYSLVAPNQQLYDFGTGEIRFKPVDYVITKSMIPNLTRYLATFYAKNNIRCNAIAPHGIYNQHDEAFVVNFNKLSPMGRMAGRDEMSGPFLFLVSDASSYMTGSVLTVDGGWTAW
jgi:2-deoxy-D-gluconate 3-dehydrogenase